jgi:hypothetical protein
VKKSVVRRDHKGVAYVVQSNEDVNTTTNISYTDLAFKREATNTGPGI